jgi:hypothetical protein
LHRGAGKPVFLRYRHFYRGHQKAENFFWTEIDLRLWFAYPVAFHLVLFWKNGDKQCLDYFSNRIGIKRAVAGYANSFCQKIFYFNSSITNMPDLFIVFAKRWRFILGLTVVSGIVALVASLFSPKEYLSTATALPANSVVADKARFFNSNIETLYSDFGSPDELDRIEGTAALDTIYIEAAKTLDLPAHYDMAPEEEGLYKAAMVLKKNTRINRSGYGELKIKVWDKDRNMAATMANTILQNIQNIHQHLQNEMNLVVIQKLQEDYASKQQLFRHAADTVLSLSGADAEILQAKKSALLEQLQQDEKLMDQYRFAISTNPQVLLTVEKARPSLWPDKPKILSTVLIAIFGAFVISFFIGLFIESRIPKP